MKNPESATMSSFLPVSEQQARLPNQAPEMGEMSNKKIIRDLGLKVTHQRLQILDAVRRGPSHFTAQDIFESVSQENAAIGFATVYRFLKTLSAHHYVTEVRMGGMPARYEWASKRHHDHLTCTTCGKVVEFENQKIEMLQDEVAESLGFILTHHVLELFGVCKICRQRATADSSTN